jgi:hypothetical protein
MDTNVEATYNYLKQKYNRLIISKKEYAFEANIKPSTLDFYIAKNINVCKYSKRGTAKNASLDFHILDVAIFLSSDKIETM